MAPSHAVADIVMDWITPNIALADNIDGLEPVG
jgi:hypothetical protein